MSWSGLRLPVVIVLLAMALALSALVMQVLALSETVRCDRADGASGRSGLERSIPAIGPSACAQTLPLI